MCGLTGFIDFSRKTSSEVLESMVSELQHRGPDDRGCEIRDFDNARVGLGHTRLSIIDLSPAGHQPMRYNNYEIVFNGEIYNYKEIKAELTHLGHIFETGTDTEVILHAYEEWGKSCVERFIGMFAIAILDSSLNKIILIRDRVGVKPLYYYYNDGLFLFSSELKSFHKHPSFIKKINTSALKLYFDFFYIPAPQCIFEHSHKLKAGHILELSLTNGNTGLIKYWDPDFAFKQSKIELSYKETRDELEKLLFSAFSYRMVSDVPVGVFLSGGYDSTAVASILQSQSSNKLRTFTIGFHEGNNEAPAAKETASFIGTDHTEYYCDTKEAQNIIPDLPYYFDEPFGDSSAIPTMLVSKMTKQDVTVALSADGGDELFAGYSRYAHLASKNKALNTIPDILKWFTSYMAGTISDAVPVQYIDIKHKLDGVSRSLSKNTLLQSKNIYKLAHSLPKAYVDNVLNFESEVYDTPFDKNENGFDNEIDIALSVDYQMYLQDDILTKVDRATMSVSLEGREPFLDHRLQEFAARIPLHYKMQNGSLKYILKDIVHKYVPEKLMNRPKSGFSLPINSWLRNDLSYLLEEHLSEKELKKHDLFNVDYVLKLVEQFKQNKLYYSPLIWKLLMFQMWYKRWME